MNDEHSNGSVKKIASLYKPIAPKRRDWLLISLVTYTALTAIVIVLLLSVLA